MHQIWLGFADEVGDAAGLNPFPPAAKCEAVVGDGEFAAGGEIIGMRTADDYLLHPACLQSTDGVQAECLGTAVATASNDMADGEGGWHAGGSGLQRRGKYGIA